MGAILKGGKFFPLRGVPVIKVENAFYFKLSLYITNIFIKQMRNVRNELYAYVWQYYPSRHMTSIQCRVNVDATSWRCIDVETTLYKRHVPAGMTVIAQERNTNGNIQAIIASSILNAFVTKYTSENMFLIIIVYAHGRLSLFRKDFMKVLGLVHCYFPLTPKRYQTSAFTNKLSLRLAHNLRPSFLWKLILVAELCPRLILSWQ